MLQVRHRWSKASFSQGLNYLKSHKDFYWSPLNLSHWQVTYYSVNVTISTERKAFFFALSVFNSTSAWFLNSNPIFNKFEDAVLFLFLQIKYLRLLHLFLTWLPNTVPEIHTR